jgi:predicted tellurium resistance membrane protein TerC
MSLDNVLAVGGAAHGNIANLVIGLIVSIILMVVASGYIAKLLDRYPSIQWVGLFVILFTALEMMEK